MAITQRSWPSEMVGETSTSRTLVSGSTLSSLQQSVTMSCIISFDVEICILRSTYNITFSWWNASDIFNHCHSMWSYLFHSSLPLASFKGFNSGELLFGCIISVDERLKWFLFMPLSFSQHVIEFNFALIYHLCCVLVFLHRLKRPGNTFLSIHTVGVKAPGQFTQMWYSDLSTW